MHFLKTLFFILPLLIIGATLEARTIEQNELTDLNRQIQAEIALLKTNPKAQPSPKLRNLQRQAQSLQQSIRADVEYNLKKEVKKQAKSAKDQILKYKKELGTASNAAISTLTILSDGLDTESKLLQRKINNITDRRDVSQFLTEEGRDTKDAKEVRRLNAQLDKIKDKRQEIAKDRQSILDVKSGVKHAQDGMKALDTYNDMQSVASNYKEGKYLEAGKGSLEIIKKYLPDNTGKIKAQQEAFSLLLETSSTKKAINKGLAKEMDKIAGSLEKLQTTEKLSKGIDKSVKILNALIEMKKHKDAWDARGEDGRTSADSKAFISVMNGLGALVKTFSGVLPPGARDLLDFYGDAMSLPGTFNDKMLEIYDRDTGVGVSGALANSKAIKDYQEKHPYAEIDKDLVLNPNGSLGVYKDVHDNVYIIITDPDKPIIRITQEEYDKIAQIASDLAAIGQKFTNSMLQSLLDSDFKTLTVAGTVWDTIIDVDKLSGEADRAKDELRIREILSQMMSPEDITDELIKQYKEYERFIDTLHGSDNTCDLSDKMVKNLFDLYQKKSPKFNDYVASCTKKKVTSEENNSSTENNTTLIPPEDTNSTDDNITIPQPVDNNVSLPSSCDSDSDCADGEICDESICVEVPIFACESDADCIEGELCSDEICIAIPAVTCNSDVDCIFGESCSDNVCVALPPYQCSTDTDCYEGEMCSDEACVAIPALGCSSNADCAVDEICSDESCIIAPDLSCSTDSDCPVGKICSDDNCMSISIPDCISDSDCAEGESCSDETCIVPAEFDCISDSDCPSGETCSDQICIMSMPDCISDSDCAPDKICSGETCIIPQPECTSNADCPSGKVCSAETCITPKPQGCSSDHDCPLDKICSLSNICVASANGGYNENVWEDKEADREQEVGDRYAQDTEQALLDRFNQDDMEQERKDRIELLTSQSSQRNHSEGEDYHSDEPTPSYPVSSRASRSSKASQSSQASSSSKPSRASSSSKASRPSKPPKSASTQTSTDSKYYIVTTSNKTLNHTSYCNNYFYSIVGPMTSKKAAEHIKEVKFYTKKKNYRSMRSFPLSKNWDAKISKGYAIEPDYKEPLHKCTNCPSGQHIGLDPGKQQCHGN